MMDNNECVPGRHRRERLIERSLGAWGTNSGLTQEHSGAGEDGTLQRGKHEQVAWRRTRLDTTPVHLSSIVHPSMASNLSIYSMPGLWVSGVAYPSFLEAWGRESQNERFPFPGQLRKFQAVFKSKGGANPPCHAPWRKEVAVFGFCFPAAQRHHYCSAP